MTIFSVPHKRTNENNADSAFGFHPFLHCFPDDPLGWVFSDVSPGFFPTKRGQTCQVSSHEWPQGFKFKVADKEKCKIAGVCKSILIDPERGAEVHFVKQGFRPGSGSEVVIGHGDLNGIAKRSIRTRMPIFN